MSISALHQLLHGMSLHSKCQVKVGNSKFVPSTRIINASEDKIPSSIHLDCFKLWNVSITLEEFVLLVRKLQTRTLDLYYIKVQTGQEEQNNMSQQEKICVLSNIYKLVSHMPIWTAS